MTDATQYTVIVAPSQPVVVVQPGATNTQQVAVFIAGPPGMRGEAGTVPVLTYLASGAIGGHRVVCSAGSGSARYADSSTTADAACVLGLSTAAALNGAPVDIQYSGEITEPSWSWTPSLPVFCGLNGLPTQTPPTLGFQLVIGVATSATSIFMAIKQPLHLI